MQPGTQNFHTVATQQLGRRRLARVPGEELAFAWQGQVVKLSIEESVYRGHFVTVHDDGYRPPRQFRARHGDFDWNAIAAAIVDIAEARLKPPATVQTATQVKEQNQQLADELATITGAGPGSQLSIRPSATSPGRVRVRLDEIDLDPVSVIQLYAAVSQALPPKIRNR